MYVLKGSERKWNKSILYHLEKIAIYDNQIYGKKYNLKIISVLVKSVRKYISIIIKKQLYCTIFTK